MLDHTRPQYQLTVNRHFAEKKTEYEQRPVTVNFQTGEKLTCRVPKSWSDNAAATLMSKYAVRAGVPDEMGGVNGREVDAECIFDRLVAGWRAAAIEHGYWEEDSPHLAAFCAEVKAMLEQQVAAPNSPQWFNTGVAVQYGIQAGSDGHYYATVDNTRTTTVHACEDSLAHPQISACFIQSVEDKLVGEGGIMDLWEREARLFKYGSGSGANYSKLRGKGEPLSRGGASSGLLSFLRVGDRSAGAIKSGGTTRRSARMIIVDVDHPDVEEFIGWKAHEDKKIRALHAAGYGDPSSFEDEATETVSGQNANNSVAVSDEFMHAVVYGRDWNLHARTDGSVTKTVPARELWEKIAQAAWECADPGLQFSDTINEWHTCKADGSIRGANPCAEYIFLDDTACNLASLNLAKFHAPDKTRGFDFSAYEHAARLWTIVLDVSVSMAGYPTAEIARRSVLYRTLGLGYAALGELLVLLGLGYGTAEGQAFAAELTARLTGVAYLTSTELARKLGPFPRFEANREDVLAVIQKHGEACGDTNSRMLWLDVMRDAAAYGVRNAQVSLLAPTGTIGIVMDCETTGVEPFYSDTTIKTLAGGGVMRLASKRFAEVMRNNGYDPVDYTRQAWTAEGDRVLEYVWIEPPTELADVLVCASDLTPTQHIDMMAEVQPFLSGAISKSVNCPSDTTPEEVAELYTYAWKRGLKSIAIYRDGCKPAQPLQGRKPSPGVKTYSSREAAERALPIDTFAEQMATHAPAEDERLHTPLKNLNPPDVAFTFNGRPVTSTSAQSFTVERMSRGQRLNPPDTAKSVKVRVELSGHTFYLICGEHDDGSLAEVFVVCPRTGSAMSGWVNAWAKTFSLGLQHGTPLAVLVDAMRGETFDPAGFHDGRGVTSPVDAFARIIEKRYLSDEVNRATPPVIEISNHVLNADVRIEGCTASPEEIAKAVLAHRPTAFEQVPDGAEPAPGANVGVFFYETSKPTGQVCDNCGGMQLVRSGSCFVCRSCGETTGCS